MPSSRSTTRPLTVAEHEAAMQQAWYDLVIAEERGKDAPTLERLAARYLALLEALVAARQGSQRPQAQKSAA